VREGVERGEDAYDDENDRWACGGVFGLRPPNFRFDFELVAGVDRALFDFDKGVGGIGAGGYLSA
jgi:hypothetical protein